MIKKPKVTSIFLLQENLKEIILISVFFVGVISVYNQYSSETCILLLSMRNNCASKFNLVIINAMFPLMYAFEKGTQEVFSYYTLWVVWGHLTGNLTEIRLRSFLCQGIIFLKKISMRFLKKVVFISRVLLVLAVAAEKNELVAERPLKWT